MKTTAILTLYNPNDKNIQNIKRIRSQVDEVIVCDNSSYSNLEKIKNLDVKYFSINKNLGLSMAFNKVLSKQYISWKKDDFVIFFDQDSSIGKNHVKLLIDEFLKIKKIGVNIGCLGPAYFNTSSNKIEEPKMRKMVNSDSYITKSIITSSMLTTYGNLEKVGFWNEKVFLDMADWDLCWRMMNRGMACCMTNKVVLQHSLGLGEKRILFLRIKIGAAIREYYQTRDCLYLLKEEYVPLKYKIRFVMMITIRPIEHLLFLSDKRKRALYIYRGFKDYINKDIGEYKA